jgi:signal recognition particle subunit SRP54
LEKKMAMFENLSERLSQSLKKISGKASLSESNIQETLREVRVALLEADVALPVVKDFIELVKQRAVGTEVSASLNPGQQFLKIVQAELESVMGEKNESLSLKCPAACCHIDGGLAGCG